METNSITRAALGNIAALGDLYDARRDAFCGLTIFKKGIPAAACSVVDAHFSDIHLVHSDNFSEKFTKMDVSAELQVSVLAGLLPLSGSGRYLNDQKKSARTVKSSLIYNIKTKDESVNIYHEDLKDAFSLDAIEQGVATHVVCGISWGANSIVSCLYENKENRDVKQIGGNLSAQLQKLSLSISGKGNVEFNDNDGGTGIQFNIRMFGDILPGNDELPTTFEGALDVMRRLPALVANSNDGKGKPLAYRLIPISLLKDYLNYSTRADTILKTLEEASIIRIVQMFDQMASTQQTLTDFYQDAVDFRVCVGDNVFTEIVTLKNNAAVQETSFRAELATVLREVRSGNADVSKLEEFIQKFQASSLSPTNITATLLGYAELAERINFARALVQHGAIYVGQGASLDELLLRNFNAKLFIFYFSKDSKTEDKDKWIQNRQLFFNELQNTSTSSKYFAVDCDIHPTLKIKDLSSCIQVVEGSQVTIEDLLEAQESTKIPTARSLSTPIRIVHKPNKRGTLSLQCTGINCNPTRVYDWSCSKCLTELEYGFDSFVYCDCGKALASTLEFKCSDVRHGIAYQKHDPIYLQQILGQLKPFKDLNILIMGETGVGKSTFINAFVNFLHYETLDEAEAGSLVSLIPTKFTIYDDETFEEITVSTGTDPNEVQIPGQSATKESRVYTFPIGKTIIRLIDTPGIGDTRGIDQDQKNFQNILSTIAFHEEIHGICILLKPNNSRLNVMFRFCVKELLTYLHRDASHNILFCFTHARSTFYRPGDTMPALKKLLQENKSVEIPTTKQTVYCFDSEAFRFLAAVKNSTPVTFSEDERKNYAASWDKSMSETKRLLETIKGLRPHKTTSTLSLNSARELVLKLARPLAEINTNIQTNKAIMEDELKEIDKMKATYDNLNKKLFTTRTEIEVRKIDYPKTVCGNSSCIKIWKTSGFNTTEYVQICHDHCYLSGVKADTIGDPGLINCDAMGNGSSETCIRAGCGHHYREHLHVYYDSVQVAKKVEDQSVQETLSKNLSAREMKKELINKKKKEIEELNAEVEVIQDASARFAYFLKSNAITPYNDAIEQYLDHLISHEEEKVGQGGNKKILANLRNNRAAYIQKKVILEREMNQQGPNAMEPIGPSEVDRMVNLLKGLKHSGKALKDALESVEHTRNRVYHEAVLQGPTGGVVRKVDTPKKTKTWWQRLFWFA